MSNKYLQFNGTDPNAKSWFDEGPAPRNIMPMSTINTSSIDTSAIDAYRQGVEVTQMKHFDAGFCKITSGEPGHVLKQTDFGNARVRRVSVFRNQEILSTVVASPELLPFTDNNKSISFSQNSGAVIMGNVYGFEHTDPFSVSFWFKSTEAVVDEAIIVQKIGENRGWIITGVPGVQNLSFCMFNASHSYRVQIGTDVVAEIFNGQWHCLSIAYLGVFTIGVAAVTVYVDGVAVGNADKVLVTNTLLVGDSILNTGDFSLHYDDVLTGAFLLDEVAIFNYELSSGHDEIYNLGVPRDLSTLTDGPPVGWWRMGDGVTFFQFPTILDHSTSGNDGTMINMSASDIVNDAP